MRGWEECDRHGRGGIQRTQPCKHTQPYSQAEARATREKSDAKRRQSRCGWRCQRRDEEDGLREFSLPVLATTEWEGERNQDDHLPRMGRGGKMTAKQQNESEKKDDGEEMKFGIVGEAGSVPAIAGLRDGHQDGCGEQKKRSELKQTPHGSIVAQGE